MDGATLKKLLHSVANQQCSVEEALHKLHDLPFADLGYAKVDHHRGLRLGFPEVIMGSCKTAEQIAGIVTELGKGGENILVTRVTSETATETLRLQPALQHYPHAHALVLHQREVPSLGRGKILVATGGTGDIPVAEEACLTAELMGNEVERLFDVGVAGIHRVLSRRDRLEAATVIIVVAGMEGALPSVVGGLVPRPIIAVPTSVGYGASFGGLAALLGMLNSCAAGVTVVNIDNGFGAAFAAALINRREVAA
jgi:pyridinium-3,5-biscarboxylic acid mononucleotide synthase